MQKAVWIGLVGVVPRPGAESVLNAPAKGGFVNALAYVANEAEYRDAVELALQAIGLTAYEFESVENFAQRASKWEIDDELRECADDVVATGEVRFGTFYTYTGVE